MPSIVSGSAGTLTVPATTKPAGYSCQMQILLSTDNNGMTVVASSAMNPYTSSGQLQNVSGPITMPAVGAYYAWAVFYMNDIGLGGFYQGMVTVIGGGLFDQMTTQNVVTPLRAWNAVYYNGTGKPMFVTFEALMSGSSQYAFPFSDGANPPTTQLPGAQGSSAGTAVIPVAFIVLPGNYYMLQGYGMIRRWVETY